LKKPGKRKYWEWGEIKITDKLTVAGFSVTFVSGGQWQWAVIPIVN
jgi:hypothetical protein